MLNLGNKTEFTQVTQLPNNLLDDEACDPNFQDGFSKDSTINSKKCYSLKINGLHQLFLVLINRGAIAKGLIPRGLPRNKSTFFGSIPRTLGSRLLITNLIL